MAAVIAAGLALAIPAGASAAGCDVLRRPADRGECLARARAREVARAEVQQQLDGTTPPTGSSPRSAAWTSAVEEADGVDLGELVEPRLLAAVGGLAWFGMAVRVRRRRARAADTTSH